MVFARTLRAPLLAQDDAHADGPADFSLGDAALEEYRA